MKRKNLVGVIAIVVLVVAAMLAGCIEEEEQTQTIEVGIVYPGEWSGSYGGIDSMKTVDGTGTTTLTIPDANSIVSVTVQKKDDSSRLMTVLIGKVVKEENTSAAYGVVSISYTL